jgi:hypothetical protein
MSPPPFVNLIINEIYQLKIHTAVNTYIKSIHLASFSQVYVDIHFTGIPGIVPGFPAGAA